MENAEGRALAEIGASALGHISRDSMFFFIFIANYSLSP